MSSGLTTGEKMQDNLFNAIINAIRKSLDIEETKKSIVDVVCNSFNADRCFISEYDAKNDTFDEINYEYLASDDAKSCVGQDVNADVPNFVEEVKKGKLILVQNKEIFIDGKKVELEEEQKTLDKYSVKSLFAIPLFYRKEFLGVLSIHYLKDHLITNEEKNLMIAIADQTASAIYQAHLYEIVKSQAEKEKLISKIISTSLQTFDLNQIKHIVQDIGKVVKADRAFFVEVDVEKLRGFPIEHDCEYLASDNIKSAKGFEFGKNQVELFIKLFDEAKDLVVFDYEKIKEENKPENRQIIEYSERFDLKSGIGIPLFGDGKLNSVLAVEYANKKVLPEKEDLEFLKVLANQTSMAYNQILLYQKTQKKAEQEATLRKVIETARSSLDINEVKMKLTQEVGKTFKADRCFFRTYSKETNKFLAPTIEYRASEKIKSAIDIDPPQESLGFFADEIKRQEQGFYPIYENRDDAKGTPLEEYFESLDMKADCVIPIRSSNNEIIWLALHYTQKEPKLDDDDKKLLQIICYQIDMAFEQIHLYNDAVKTVQRQALIANITEKIRSSLNIDDTITFICEETAKIFNVQRATIVYFYDKDNYENYNIRREYKITNEIKGLTSQEYMSAAAAYWNENLIKYNLVVFDNIQESDTPDFFRECYRSMGVKSMIGSSIRREEDIWGTLVLSEYNYTRHWTKEEQELLKLIANQVYIAIKQAELYETQKLALEREKISRNIIEILRSSIDKDIIKKLFVKNIGKFFNADRVIISEYDKEKKNFLPITSESQYLASVDEMSFVGQDLSSETFFQIMKPLLEKREIKIQNYQEYLHQNPHLENAYNNFYKNSEIKSIYAFPIFYQDLMIGFFCIEFTKNFTKLSEEDINRTRNICTQAGIAIHHAELYSKAQECLSSKRKFIQDVTYGIKEPINDILTTSKRLNEENINQETQKEYLNSIIQCCRKLIELTENIQDDFLQE